MRDCATPNSLCQSACARTQACGGTPLQADPEELAHPRRQIEGGNVAGHAEQLHAEERHDVADDDPDQEHLSWDPEGCSCGDLGGEDSGDPIEVEFGCRALGRYETQ